MKVTTDSCLFGAWVAHQIKNLGANNNILDIGSGSGLLSLMLAQQSAASIDGIELQLSDYLQSLENIAKAGREQQINLFHFDARNFAYQQQYNVIISNPPFYESDLKSNIKARNIAHHDQGLKLQELVSIIQKQLTANGNCYLLLPAKRMDEVEKKLATKGLHINEIVFVHQTDNHAPFRIIINTSFAEKEKQMSNITIKKQGNYTAEFIDLLKDYYLYL